ncbi:hypothetical protein [Cupriavidus nantongensis]|uniref:ADP-ribosyltransferase-containing protein n=1 Tax=Cupriavidus nantongensis TaxID=1796606 RepID=UPI000AF90C1E|nr:hypothetical protein [Cupriavidus nantongensis]
MPDRRRQEDGAFPHTKVAGQDGSLLSVYHGTKANFAQFSRDAIGSGADSETSIGDYGDGFYFTNDREYAEAVARGVQGEGEPRIIVAHLDIRRPITKAEMVAIPEVAGALVDPYPGESVVQLLMKLGYDGIVVDGGREYVVFEPAQIKIVSNMTIAEHMNQSQGAAALPSLVPSPTDAIAAFRRARVQTAVESIAATTQTFAAVVDDSVSGERAASASVKALVKAFVASFRALQETQDAAKAAGVISHDTSSAINGVMKGIRGDFEQGVGRLRAEVDRLEAHSPGDFGDFCRTAQEKLSKLGVFWKDAAKNAPAMKM